MKRWLYLVVLAATACSNAASQTQPPAPAAATAEPVATSRRDTTVLLGAMATLTGKIADAGYLARWAKTIDSGKATIDDYIDELLANQRFSGEIMPALLFGAFVNVRTYYALPAEFTLQHPTEAGGALYLRKPCAASEAIAVKPWWNLASEVKVCPDAYRPEKWTIAADEHSYKTHAALSCDSQVGSPELETKSLCGCGPNLIRCLRDEDQYNEFNKSFMGEIKRTTAYVVDHDLPMASLFTGNSTFRDANVELYYRRQKIGALQEADVEAELADLPSWPAEGKWAPREELKPGQHAGVLTAPQLLHWLPDQRQRQRGYYEMLWCNLRNSFGATTRKVLELNHTGNNFFVHDSWQRLAHTELCTNCHARLDYGSQFFRGYPDSRASTHFMPELQSTESGPLYGQDIDDLRGEAPLTPASFAQLATDQPDFKACMTNHFVDYVLGDRADDDDITAVETAIATAGTFKQPMKVALERFAAKWSDDTAVPARAGGSATAAAPGPTGGVMINPALRAQLDKHCIDCHDEARFSNVADTDDLPFDFRSAELPRALLIRMADQVAFGMMPKSGPLDATAREQLVGLLIDSLWSDGAARAEADRYYLGRARGLPAHQVDNALYAIDQVAGAQPGLAWGALERGIWADQSTVTPDYIAVTALEAVRACARARDAGGTVSLEDCLARAMAPSALTRWTPPATTP